MIDAVDELARRRGIYFPANEAYGGVAGLYTYGPTGTSLKRRLEDAWRDRFVRRDGNDEIDSPTLVPEPVFEASGHVERFDDPVLTCPDCGARHRADHLVEAATDVAEAEGFDRVSIEDVVASRDVRCLDCGARLAGQPVETLDLMFPTAIGPTGDERAYLRPETAQGTLVEFPRLSDYARGRLPFGVAQVGRGYRNEISPRNAVVRSREFTMAELQQFFHPDEDDPPIERVADSSLRLVPGDANRRDATARTLTVSDAVSTGVVAPNWLAYYLGVTREWLDRVGVDPERLRFRQHASDELAHYATDCWDAEARVDGEWIELAGIAYRSDYDLATHAEHTDEEYAVFREYDESRERERTVVDPDMAVLGPRFGDRIDDVIAELERLAAERPTAFEGDAVDVRLDGETVEIETDAVDRRVETVAERGEHVRPHVVEPAFGIDRVLYAALHHCYREDVVDGDARERLALPPIVAPTDVAVLPLRSDRAARAERLADRLRREGFDVASDSGGSIGRRYRRQDEVGTPYCVTLDERTPEDDAATIRDRDSTAQARVAIADLSETAERLQAGEVTLDTLRDE